MSTKGLPVDEETLEKILSELREKRGDTDYYLRQIRILKEYPDITNLVGEEAIIATSHILGNLPEEIAEQLAKEAHLTFTPWLVAMVYVGYILAKKIYESQE